ncbi:MAG: DUF4876 domain-containing protein [Prolixibacteraceae bacterium]|jgi:hypothetical protein|nr:DUF4876 domain-containing protein [Prolixibacteraceae bacterium]
MRGLLFFSLLLLSASCIQEPDYQGYPVDILVDFGENIPEEGKAGARVSLFNQLKSYTLELTTDWEGKVRFLSIEPGFYSITVIHSFRVGGVMVHYNGLKDIAVFDAVSALIRVEGSSTNAFVIREFYYSGSRTPGGKTYPSDQYVEIFNNTGELQYADGLSVLEHESYATGDNFWKNINDTIVVKMVWTIPGNGAQVPVGPGKSIVLACDGINHKDDPNGNPLSPVNLGNADFEFYVYSDTNKDIDSPTIPNLIEDLFVFRGNDVSFHVTGGSALAIAKIPGETPEERTAYINRHLVSKETVSGPGTRYYMKVATKYILDAVEVTWDEAHAVYKRFPVNLDAGYTYIVSGSFSGKCIRRKIKEIVNGRAVYQDTNNSTEDFLKDVEPKPKIYDN